MGHFYLSDVFVFLVSDGRQERVMFDKITSRIQKLCYGLNSEFVDPVSYENDSEHLQFDTLSMVNHCLVQGFSIF